MQILNFLGEYVDGFGRALPRWRPFKWRWSMCRTSCDFISSCSSSPLSQGIGIFAKIKDFWGRNYALNTGSIIRGESRQGNGWSNSCKISSRSKCKYLKHRDETGPYVAHELHSIIPRFRENYINLCFSLVYCQHWHFALRTHQAYFIWRNSILRKGTPPWQSKCTGRLTGWFFRANWDVYDYF